ncbi:MAG: NAD(P)/FAD-dependent oxidoreductase [Clostridiales bacterium]|nr:NAD(P)/FAD-dependent oxidoreductase [Clostridiales bacterium]
MYDILLIGAGVTGCAVARVLSRYEGRIAVLEKGEDVAVGASKANSGIVHAGFDAHTGTKKAYYNVKGAGMYPQLAAELGVPYQNNGSLVLGFTDEDLETLKELKTQGEANGVEGLSLLDKQQVLDMEPMVNPAVTGALLAATAGIVSPYEMTIALAYHAAQNGVEFVFDAPVESIDYKDGIFTVTAGGKQYQARAVINCAGVHSGHVRGMLSAEKVAIVPRRGEYYLLDHTVKCPFTHTMFQCPGKMGKGVLVTPTAHGNVLLGPSAEEIPDGDDTVTTREGLDFVLEKCRLTWPGVNTRGAITAFSGNRAHCTDGDFHVGAVPGASEGAFEATGVESPGLTAAPAIGEELGNMAAAYLKLPMKNDYQPAVPLNKAFFAMTDEERADACRRDPLYGNLICRCEQVTEAEIRDALRRPVPARSLDGVKRRTRAGMGRCQGGFCSPRVVEIICEETGMDPLEVTKCGGESYLLTGTLKKEG